MDCIFIICKWIRQLCSLLFAQLDKKLVLVEKRLELVVNDLERITHNVVVLFKCSERGQYRIVNALNKDDFFEGIKFSKIFVLFTCNNDALLFLLFFKKLLILD